MIELSKEEVLQINGGFRIHIPVKFMVTIVAAVGATMVGGPGAGGMVLAGAIAAQGTENLTNMFNNAQFDYVASNPQYPTYYW